jgi:hypothetical protein
VLCFNCIRSEAGSFTTARAFFHRVLMGCAVPDVAGTWHPVDPQFNATYRPLRRKGSRDPARRRS